jgi:hypothetical protein
VAVADTLTTVKEPNDAEGRYWTFRARGLAAYRAGDWEAALEWCVKSRECTGRPHWHAQNLIVEAMALHQLKKADEAKAVFQKALTLGGRAFPNATGDGGGYGTRWQAWIGFELHRREAEALLQSDTNDRSSDSINDG